MLILQVLLSLLLLGGFIPAQAARESDYLTRDYGRFAVTYCPEDSALSGPLVEVLSQRLPIIAARLRLSVPDSARFVITPSAQEWGRVTAGSPLWANGVAYPSRGIAVLKSPRFNANGGPSDETAVHELVHLLLESGAPNSTIPRWLNEGLAQFMAGQQEFMDVHLIARASASGRLMSFWDIQGMMAMGSADARQGYAQSLAAVEELWQRFGDSGLANLVHELRIGKEIEEVFLTLFGLPVGQFEREHQAELRTRYGGSLWSDSELWISLLFVILVLSAGTFAYFRRRRTLKGWKNERFPEESHEPREAPYTINYTIVRARNSDGESEPAPEDNPPHDRPLSGN